MSPRQAAPGTGKRYDEDYFSRELHREHWFTNNPAKHARRWQAVVRMLEPRRDDRLLEIGCAAGMHTLKLAPLVREAVGIDRAFAGVAVAQATMHRLRIANAAFAVCDAARLAFADGAFDKVAAIDFVEHVDDDALIALLREVGRVLAENGRIAIYTPCATHYVEWLKAHGLVLKQIEGHIGVRPPGAYVALLARAGFAVQAQWFLPSDYPAFGLVDRLLMKLPGLGPWFRFRICLVAMKLPS
jgi:SAM-dependent methyltransferase